MGFDERASSTGGSSRASSPLHRPTKSSMGKQRAIKKHAWASSVSLSSFGQSKALRVSADHELDETYSNPTLLNPSSFDMNKIKYGAWNKNNFSPVAAKAARSYFKPDAYGLTKKNMWEVPSTDALFVRP
jgi:hypothetical protein